MGRWLKVLGAGVLVYVAITVVDPSVASAADGQPCGPQWRHPRAGIVQYCPDWSPDNQIPVYPTYAYTGQRPVGYIYAPGADWYTCETQGNTYAILYNGQTLQNNWWAGTLSDDGHWGWVPEVFFRGGNNFEPDAGLRRCAI